MPTRLCAIVAIIWLLLPTYGRVWASEILSQDMSALIRTDDELLYPEDKNPKLAEIYERVRSKIDRVSIAELSDLDVQNFYAGAEKLSFYFNDSRYANDLRVAFDELERRQLSTPAMVETVLGHYFAARMFDTVGSFSASHPSDSDFGVVAYDDHTSASSAAKLLRIGSDGRTMSAVDFSIPPGTHVIVVSSPWCAFSRASGRAISRTPQLLSLMRMHATWIVPQSIIPNVKDIVRWNTEHPNLSMSIVFDRTQWGSIESWATPGFYFYRDGNLVSSVIGWESDSKVDALIREFDALNRVAKYGAIREPNKEGGGS